MKPEEIKLSDWTRILVGEVPGEFYIELIIRTFFIFFLLVLSMRLLGRRMAAQLDRMELIALFSLAAAIGVPLQAPDRGLLPAVVIAFVVVGVGRLVATLAFSSQKLEGIAKDKLTILVENGVVHLKRMEKTRVTHERLFAQLRTNKIRHLGEVKRLYFEANGSFSLIREDHPQPGLAIIPGSDRDFLDEQPQADITVCKTCGNKTEEHKPCANYGEEESVMAIR